MKALFFSCLLIITTFTFAEAPPGRPKESVDQQRTREQIARKDSHVNFVNECKKNVGATFKCTCEGESRHVYTIPEKTYSGEAMGVNDGSQSLASIAGFMGFTGGPTAMCKESSDIIVCHRGGCKDLPTLSIVTPAVPNGEGQTK